MKFNSLMKNNITIKIFLTMMYMTFYSSILFADNLKIISKYYLDSNNSYTTENIYENVNQFVPLSKEFNNFGLTQDTVWIYAKVTNNSNEKSKNIINFPYPLLDYILVLNLKDGKVISKYLTGDLVKFDSREIKTSSVAVPYTIEANETKEFLFKINSKGALNIDIRFLEFDEFHTKDKNDKMILGIYYGAVIIMLIYNLILYFNIKDIVYMDYVIFHFSFLLLQLGLNGLTFEYFWNDYPQINNYFVPIMLITANFFSILFTISFLELKKNHPAFYKYTSFLVLISLLLLAFTFILEYSFVIKTFALFSILSSSSLFLIGLYILIKTKNTNSKFFVYAWGFLLVGVILTDLQNLGILPVNILTYYGSQIGAFVELTLLSFALGHRYNELFAQLRQTQSNLSLLNKNLEDTVLQRTQKLNDELKNKNFLLRELHHRVKNNLQIISSLISLQIKRVKDTASCSILEQTNFRILSISMIHEKLYQSENFEKIAMQDYIKELIDELRVSFSNIKDITFIVECKAMEISLDKAVPIGLIINELVTNSVKYAFTDANNDKKIYIKMDKQKNKINLTIRDNGIGVNVEDIQQGFGFKLLKTLTKFQLKASVDYFNNDGFNYEIVFDK